MIKGRTAHHRVPIRHDVYAKIAMPLDLTSEEAEKICWFVKAMVVPTQKTVPGSDDI